MPRWTDEQYRKFLAKNPALNPESTPMSRYVLDNPAPGRELQKLLVRQSKDVDGLNKLERAFYLHLLQQGYPKIYVQSVTLKLADKCRYTCDFICIDELGNWLGYEVKGAHMWEDSWVKVKV